jgi:hypothetical protein
MEHVGRQIQLKCVFDSLIGQLENVYECISLLWQKLYNSVLRSGSVYPHQRIGGFLLRDLQLMRFE